MYIYTYTYIYIYIYYIYIYIYIKLNEMYCRPQQSNNYSDAVNQAKFKFQNGTNNNYRAKEKNKLLYIKLQSTL